VTTGISAYDRAQTIQGRPSKPAARPEDFARPGHVFPAFAHAFGGVPRAAAGSHRGLPSTLASLAGFHPAGVICEILNADGDDGPGARPGSGSASGTNLLMITIADLAALPASNLISKGALGAKPNSIPVSCERASVPEEQVRATDDAVGRRVNHEWTSFTERSGSIQENPAESSGKRKNAMDVEHVQHHGPTLLGDAAKDSSGASRACGMAQGDFVQRGPTSLEDFIKESSRGLVKARRLD